MSLPEHCTECKGPIDVPLVRGIELGDGPVFTRTDQCANGHQRDVAILRYPFGGRPPKEVTRDMGSAPCHDCSETTQIACSSEYGSHRYRCPSCLSGPLETALEALE
jgi:hypothetical protein